MRTLILKNSNLSVSKINLFKSIYNFEQDIFSDMSSEYSFKVYYSHTNIYAVPDIHITSNGVWILLGSPKFDGKFLMSKCLATQYTSGYQIIKHLGDFEGPFVLIYIERGTCNMLLVRDKFGGVPLYCAFDDHDLIGISTKSNDLLNVLSSVHIDYSLLARYVACRYDDVVGRDEMLLSRLIKMPPATIIDTRIDNTPIKYWDFGCIQKNNNYSCFETVCNEVSMRLSKSSQSCYEKSNNNFALALSGGLDSSILASIYASLGIKLHAVTATYGNNVKCDESISAKNLCSNLGHTWSPVNISPISFYDKLLSAYERHDFPLTSSSTLGYDFIYENIINLGFSDLIVGTKSDRMFSGNYPYYLFNLADLYVTNSPSFSSELRSWILNHGTPEFVKSKNVFLDFLNTNIDCNNYGRIIPRPKILNLDYVRHEKLNEIVGSSKDIEYSYASYLQSYTAYETWHYGVHSVDARNSWYYKNGLTLHDPYEDENFFKYCWWIPSEYKIKNGVNKYLLRKIAKKSCPNIKTSINKIGFTVPFDNWSKSSVFRDLIIPLIEEGIKGSPLNYYINLSKINENFQKGLEVNSMLLWQVVNALLWEKSISKKLHNY